MRTHSGKTDTPSTPRGRVNMIDPLQAPTLDNTLTTLVNVNTDNARLLQTWAQYGVPVSWGHLDPEADNTYRDFLKTHPPVFHKAEEPLEAEDWIRTIEQKFGLIRCSDVQKTLFVAQQLQGSAGAWWASFLATQPEGHQVPWVDFCTTFQTHYIPDGVREVKVEQFLKLQLGDQSVMEYLGRFNQLSQYASEYVSIDIEKKRCFVRGLHTKLQVMLASHINASYNEILSIAISTNDKNRQHI